MEQQERIGLIPSVPGSEIGVPASANAALSSLSSVWDSVQPQAGERGGFSLLSDMAESLSINRGA